MSRLYTVFALVGLLLPVALAQEPPATQPTTQPAVPQGATAITARVLEVRGDCRHAPADSTDWQPCQVDDEYPQNTVILTGVRSSVKLQIGTDDTYTALIIEPASKTLIAEAFTTPDTKRVNIGVGYGRIRAGVAEGGLKSDFTVESPVATLSKRGTWDFGLFYERGTDRFEIFLLESGLLEALNKLTGEQRRVLPTEIITQVMRRWLDESQIRRNVPVPDIFGYGDLDIVFNRLQTDGLRIIGPEGGTHVFIDLSSSWSQASFANLARQFLPPQTGPRLRPEGVFGTGRGEQLIPLILSSDSDLVQRGVARPGTYTFRRSVLENWLAAHGRK